MAHAGENDQANAAEHARGFERNVILLIVFDLVDDVVQVLTGNEDDDDDSRDEGNQVVNLEIGLLSAQKHRIHNDVQHDDPEVRRVFDDIGEVFFEDILENRERAVKAIIAHVRETNNQEITLQKKYDFDLVKRTTHPNRRPWSTVTKMSE